LSDGERMRDAFCHSGDVASEALADRAKNTEGYIPLAAFYSYEIASV